MADDGGYDIAELAGGRRMEVDAGGVMVLLERGVEGLVADGTVGIADVAAVLVDVGDARRG